MITLLEFDNISERYAADSYKYVVGTLKLESLIKNRELLLDPAVFVAYTGRQIYKQELLSENVFAEELAAL
ncbi:hypothetical protein D3C85_1763870 [compost metagenome]